MTPKQRDTTFEIFDSHEAADEADLAYYRSLSGNERLRIMLELMGPSYAANPRLERVYRIDELSRG